MTNSMSIKMSGLSLKMFAILAITLVSSLFIGVNVVEAAAFNNLSTDLETLTMENRTTNPGVANWRDPISVNGGDAISFRFYYHNTEVGTTANNVRLRIAYPTVAGTSIITTGTILSDNAAPVSDTGTINSSTAQTITFETTAMWYPNQTTSGGISLPVSNTGTYVEVNIGNIAGGWPAQGNVVFRATVSSTGVSGNPVVNAGADITLNEGQTANLLATATDPQGDPMTYAWSCTGGTLSSSTILNPVYTAPAVTIATTYVCTFTATDNSSNTGTDTINITVLNIAGPNDPIVDAGASMSVNEGQTVVLPATATDPQGDPMTYAWSCTGGTLSSSTILNPNYTAPLVNANTTYVCTLVVTDNGGNVGSDNIVITVIDTGSGGGGGGSGGGSPSVSVSLSASPSTGLSPLNGVDLIATANIWGISDSTPITYKFDCEGDNAFELTVQTIARTYTAQDVCNYFYDGTYTAKVKVEVNGYDSWNQVNIRVGYLPGGGTYGISVDAGSAKDIYENQSTQLYGYAYSQYSNIMSYYWTCNGGSLSNSTTLSPTYYAPSVNVDTTYACTLYVTDGRGYKNSDSVNIIVRNGVGTGYSTGLKVTTNSPETVDTTSAILKGTLNNDGGKYTSVRFVWGKLSSYNNNTAWSYNRTSGQIFTSLITGLEQGKAYHYKVEASNGVETVMGQDVAFVTKPDPTTGFSASAAGTGQISLTWNNGKAACYTMVTRKAGSYPANSGDGTIVYYGTGTAVTDRNLNNGTWYYYRAWSVACDEGLVSYSASQYARAYTSGTGYVAPVIIVEKNASVEALVRDITQNEIAWQSSIDAVPNDEIEFKIIITPTGVKSLDEVVLKAVISDKIVSIKDIKVNDEAYTGTLSEDMKLGTIALGESKVITFTGKIDKRDKFSYGSNEVISTISITAQNNPVANKTIKIDVSRGVEGEAGLISLIDLRTYAWILSILFLILLIIIIYLLIERKREQQCLVEKAAATKVEKSKYFNIK